jgi:predicted DNA-binding protein (UPF0251 family)
MKFRDAMHLPHFLKDMELIRLNFEDDSAELHLPILELLRRYNLPRSCYELIRHKICFGIEMDVATLPSPVILISQKDDFVGPGYDMPLSIYWKNYPIDHVLLELTGEIQKQDLLDFINDNWTLIESKLELIEPNRPRAVKGKQLAKLHAEVLRLRDEEKLSRRQIAGRLGLEEENVKTILRRATSSKRKRVTGIR